MTTETLSPKADAILHALMWESESVYGSKYPGTFLFINEIIAHLGRTKFKEYLEWISKGSRFKPMQDLKGNPLNQKNIEELASLFRVATGPLGNFTSKWHGFDFSERSEKIVATLQMEANLHLQPEDFSLTSYVERMLSDTCSERISTYQTYLAKDRFPIQIDKGVWLKQTQAEEALKKFRSASTK